jgi:hypothetical protein
VHRFHTVRNQEDDGIEKFTYAGEHTTPENHMDESKLNGVTETLAFTKTQLVIANPLITGLDPRTKPWSECLVDGAEDTARNPTASDTMILQPETRSTIQSPTRAHSTRSDA